MTKTFRVQLNIIKKPYDRPVHFKVDGARFETADKTVKFNVNAKYNLDFTFRPPQLLESVSSYLLYLLHRRIFLGGGAQLPTPLTMDNQKQTSPMICCHLEIGRRRG